MVKAWQRATRRRRHPVEATKVDREDADDAAEAEAVEEAKAAPREKRRDPPHLHPRPTRQGATALRRERPPLLPRRRRKLHTQRNIDGDVPSGDAKTARTIDRGRAILKSGRSDAILAVANLSPRQPARPVWRPRARRHWPRRP